MNNPSSFLLNLLSEQQAIRAKCFHPTGAFVEFRKEEIEQSIPERFEKIVQQFPQRLAVKSKDYEITYDALNRAANRLARAILAARGAGREPVALLLPKGTALVAAILGSLKAGKICMPLDPALPQARLSYMVEDAQAGMLLTNREYFAMAAAVAEQRKCINCDELDTDDSPDNPGPILAPDDLAFIFYTSGSTGTPKGIVENHRNLLHHIMHDTNNFHLCVEDRVALVASGGGRDVFRAVLNGGAVYPMHAKDKGLTELADWLMLEKITFLTAVVSLYRHLVDVLTGEEQFPYLRLIKLIGEPVYRRDVERYQKYFSPGCVLVNSYGPNETGHLCHYLIDKNTHITSNAVPVGYAVDGKNVVILNEDGQQGSAEQIGEIAVRSSYLSPGYWRRPDLTSAAFSASSEGAERLYRTGDLGSMQADGCLTYLGRKDLQVKIRGYRVEIDEVETALMDLEGVKEAVVVACEDVVGQKRLVAYIIMTSKPAPAVNVLRRALAAKLPDYMIPSTFVTLDKFPLLATGKVDRRALPKPGNARPELDTLYVPPRSPAEKALANIWAEVLALDRVGIRDSFFDLGGDSLGATRVVSRVIKEFQLELPLGALFESPTVADMANIITQNQAGKTTQGGLERILTVLENMSEQEAKALLAKESGNK